jgi:hypothetical protein
MWRASTWRVFAPFKTVFHHICCHQELILELPKKMDTLLLRHLWSAIANLFWITGSSDEFLIHGEHSMNLQRKNTRIEIIRCQLYSWLKRKCRDNATDNRTVGRLNIETRYEYSKMLAGVPMHFRGLHGTRGHTVGDSCFRPWHFPQRVQTAVDESVKSNDIHLGYRLAAQVRPSFAILISKNNRVAESTVPPVDVRCVQHVDWSVRSSHFKWDVTWFSLEIYWKYRYIIFLA